MHRPKTNQLAGIWPGRTAVLIASGPSLTAAQVEALAGPHAFGDIVVAGVNDAYRICPFLDLLYAADDRWWFAHGVEARAKIRAAYVPGDGNEPPGPHIDRFDLVPIPGRHEGGISPSDEFVHLGQHSGFQLLNIAVNAGVRRVLLLGYDYRIGAAGRHWFGDHPDGLNRDSPYDRFRYELEYAAPGIAARGVEVVNCSPGSALTCFPRADILDVLP